MNYIKHLNKAFQVMYADDRLSPPHVTLYFALFKQWNQQRFRNPMLVNNRAEIMMLAKIHSVTTYTRCLKDLHEWEFLEYLPSFNALTGSKVKMQMLYTDTFPDTLPENGQVNGQLTGKVLYINNTKLSKERETENPPTLNEVDRFFEDEGYPSKEAKKFFHHYQANGWKIAGTIPMINWHAAAHKWMLNDSTFKPYGNNQSSCNNQSAGRLHASTGKDYSEPL